MAYPSDSGATAAPVLIHPASLPGAAAPASPGGGLSPLAFAAGQAAKTTSSLNQYLNYLSTNMGRLAGQQATAETNAYVSPLLAGVNAQEKTGAQAITGYTRQLAGALGGIGTNIAGAYTTAEGQQAAIDSALAAQLGGAGNQQAADLASTLAARGQDTSPAAQAAAQTQGYVGANYATGSAGLSALVGEGAAAKAYGDSLPGIAALSGLQAMKGLQITSAADQAKIIADAQAKYPTLVNQAQSALLRQQSNAIVEQRNQESAQLSALANQIRQQTANTAAARAANTATYQQGELGLGAAKVNIAQQNANTGAARLRVTASHDAALERIAAGKAATGSQLTESATAKLVQGWTNGTVKTVRVPALDQNGKQVYNAAGVPQYVSKSVQAGTVSYQDQIRGLVALGKTEQQAQKTVDGFVKPGVNGRPWLTADQTAVLAKTGANVGRVGGGSHVVMLNGHAVLDPSQVAALKAANKLPDGQLTAEGFYVIGA